MRIVCFATLVVFGLVSDVLAGEGSNVQRPLPPAWEEMKKLVGSWEGVDVTSNDGKKMLVRYDLTSGDTALEETLFEGTAHEMVSLYHPDGQRLLMTHYCAVGNQVRMTARGEKDKDVLDFQFLDATNMTSADDGHMHELRMTFLDDNRLHHQWTFYEKGKPAMTKAFSFRRKEKTSG